MEAKGLELGVFTFSFLSLTLTRWPGAALVLTIFYFAFFTWGILMGLHISDACTDILNTQYHVSPSHLLLKRLSFLIHIDTTQGSLCFSSRLYNHERPDCVHVPFARNLRGDADGVLGRQDGIGWDWMGWDVIGV